MTDLFPVLDWTDFVYFAIPSIVLLAISAVSALMSKRGLAVITGVAAVVIFAFFIGGMWHSLQRPPLRTMGETRLWYAFFCDYSRSNSFCPLAIQVDIGVFGVALDSIYDNQYSKARNSQQNDDARSGKPLFRTTCNILYFCLCHACRCSDNEHIYYL